MTAIENAIKQKIEQTNKTTHVLYVRCPKSVERKKGIVFSCPVKGKTTKGTAAATAIVTVTSDKGAVHYVVK